MGNPDDAHDAAQDTFLIVVPQARSVPRRCGVHHVVASRRCERLLRQPAPPETTAVAARRERPRTAPPEPGPPVADHADEVVGTRDAALALAAIAEEYRIALVLADVQDLPYEEIAKILDVPVGTVKSRVHRGRLALAKAMGIARPVPRHPATGNPRGRSRRRRSHRDPSHRTARCVRGRHPDAGRTPRRRRPPRDLCVVPGRGRQPRWLPATRCVRWRARHA